MTQRTFLDYIGLKRFLSHLKTIIPTKTSDIQNDSGYLTQHNPVDSSLSDTSENAVQNKVVKDALDGKSDTGHTHTASEVSGLSTVATSGSYNDLSNTPTIPTVNNAKLTIQRNGTTVKTFTANASSNVTANITVPTAVSELTNDSGYLTSASSLDSSKLTGTIDIARLPKGALERLVTVANQTARFALTTSDVQLGDTVKQLDTGVMYIVTDETKLSSADGYTEYTAGSATSVPWSGVTGKPSSYTPSSHTHGNVTNDGKLPTASRALISDSSKNITVSSVTDTELGYLSGVTSSVQTQLNGKAASNHVHGNITNDGKVGTTANKPLITGTGGVVQAGSFGNQANTFCEGNDARLSDARTPVAHTHTKSDVTDLFNSANTWSANNTYSANCIIYNSDNSGSVATLRLRNSKAEVLSTGNTISEQSITFRDKNDVAFCHIKGSVQSNGTALRIGTYTKDSNNETVNAELQLLAFTNGNKAIFPSTADVYNLGLLGYQWKSVYAQSYYYNGVAWGLDQANTWTAQNSFNSDLNLNYASTDVDDIVNSVAGSATLDNFVHMTGNETVNGIKSFPDGVIANVTGSATSATNDGSGNVISTTYGKLGAANTWSGEQTFSQTIQGNAATASAFDTAKSITLTGAVTGTVSGTNSWEIATVLKTGSAYTGVTVPDPYFKIASWEVNPNKYFGAILQIQNKCYPHNVGTLIISVRTKSDATFQRGYLLLNNAIGLLPSEFILCYKEVTGKVLCELYYYSTTPFNGIRFSVISEGLGIQEGDSLFNTMIVYRDPAGVAALPSDYTTIQTSIGTYTQDFIPYSTNAYDLGTSTNKWKTLNGTNPGALSLPSTATTDASGDIVPPSGESSINLSGNANTYTPSNNGWLTLAINCASGNCIIVRQNTSNRETLNYMQGYVPGQTNIYLTVPVLAGVTYYVFLYATSFVMARFALCQGNV